MEHKGSKNSLVFNVFTGVLENTGGFLLELHYMRSIIMTQRPSNVLVFQISAFSTYYEGVENMPVLKVFTGVMEDTGVY